MFRGATIAFSIMMVVTVAILMISISRKNADAPVLIDDQPLKVVNRIEGINGPALYVDQRLHTSLYNCNRTDKTVTVVSTGIFKKEEENIVIVIDPASILRRPGCETTIRMSTGIMRDRGLTPGMWHIEGTRVARFNGKEQTITFKSESFQVVAR